jgi:peptidoglycan hydrolase CwlO-like protein
MSLDPAAHPSAKYTKKYDRATSLQRELEKEQKRLKKQQAELERQQAALEARQAELEREGAALQRQEAALEREAAALQARRDGLRRRALALEQRIRETGRKIAPLAARLAFIEARERLVEQLIEQTTDPDRLARLRARLARLREREAEVRARLAPLVERERRLIQRGVELARQAESLAAEAAQLEREGDALKRQGARLQAQAARLREQGDELRAEGDELEAEADAAKAQERQAKKLQRELTAMLTQAGGDPRGTDPRIVAIQGGVGDVNEVVAVSPPLINDDGDATILSAVPLRAPSSDATARLVTTLREETLPMLTGDDGVTAHVGGTTATNVDLARKISSRFAIVIVTVLLLSFVLLMIAFHSLLVPVQAAVTNLLSVGAALGVLTAVFQWGWGLSLIGLDVPQGTVPIASYVPLMMFAVLFGLSMDYEVFTVSRIAQHHAEGEDERSAVTSGLGAAGHVVTAAAAIMAMVFSSFVLNGDPTIKQFGVGLAVAVLLAGLMVVLLAPALLTLFGRAVFGLPGLLDRLLPRIDVEGGIESDEGGGAEQVPAPAPAGGGS